MPLLSLDLTPEEALLQPDVVWVAPRRYRLRSQYTYRDKELGRDIHVPEGFECDLASIPRALWLIIDPEDLGEKAALLHDWLYRHGGRIPGSEKYSREEADDLFRRCMLEDGVKPWKRRAAYSAVRGFGRAPWKRLVPLALLLLCACGGSSPPRSSAPPAPVIEPHVPAAKPLLGLGSHQLGPSEREELRHLGISHVRHTLYIETWEGSSEYRQRWAVEVRAATEAGFQLLIVVHQLPASWDPAQLGEWMGGIARLFPDVEAWQIGNEIPFGENHQAYHAHSFAEIKKADPGALVVTLAMPSEEFARAWRAPTDVYALHVYGYPLAPRAREIRSWLPADAVVWMTEFGIEQKVVGERVDWEHVQAEEWKSCVEASHGYARAYGYQLRTAFPETHGIVREDGSLRPAGVWLRSVTAGV